MKHAICLMLLPVRYADWYNQRHSALRMACTVSWLVSKLSMYYSVVVNGEPAVNCIV